MRLPGEFQTLQTLGPMFLQHLKVKVRPLAPLKQLVFIDSPGMIDAAQGTVARDYDFHGAVRQFAERADTVFFLFDPDKPGTTGETMDVFARSLRGLEFKVRVLLNKCDMGATPVSCTSPPSTQLTSEDFPDEWLPRKSAHGAPPTVTVGRENV